MSFKFLVHAKGDSVGVAVDDILVGETVQGVVMEDESTLTVKAQQDIALGHKIALVSISKDQSVKKYGEPIGKAILPIKPGEHVHVHNLRSGRW